MKMSHQSNDESSLQPRLSCESHATADVTGIFLLDHSTVLPVKKIRPPCLLSFLCTFFFFFSPAQPASFSFVRKEVAICICRIFGVVISRGRNSFNESIHAQPKALQHWRFFQHSYSTSLREVRAAGDRLQQHRGDAIRIMAEQSQETIIYKVNNQCVQLGIVWILIQTAETFEVPVAQHSHHYNSEGQ